MLDDKTAETIDAQGWLHTGDIGEWTAGGTLKVIDRKKNTLTLTLTLRPTLTLTLTLTQP